LGAICLLGSHERTSAGEFARARHHRGAGRVRVWLGKSSVGRDSRQQPLQHHDLSGQVGYLPRRLENADWSYRADGSRVRIAQRWRSYPTFRASIEDYWNFINRPKYAAGIPSLIAGDLPGFLTALRAGGYFTLPLYSTPTTQGYVPQMQAVVNTTARFLNVSV